MGLSNNHSRPTHLFAPKYSTATAAAQSNGRTARSFRDWSITRRASVRDPRASRGQPSVGPFCLVLHAFPLQTWREGCYAIGLAEQTARATWYSHRWWAMLAKCTHAYAQSTGGREGATNG